MQAKPLLEPAGWPKIIEEAVLARLSKPPTYDAPTSAASEGSVLRLLANAVKLNLTHLRTTAHAKQFQNIVANIDLAAAYLSIMTVVSKLFYS